MPDTVPGPLSGHSFAWWNSPLEEGSCLPWGTGNRGAEFGNEWNLNQAARLSHCPVPPARNAGIGAGGLGASEAKVRLREGPSTGPLGVPHCQSTDRR